MLKFLTIAIAIIGIAAYFNFNPVVSKVKTIQELHRLYDYIIVGGGSAGGILATRLSEDPDISVLLLEAGGEENELFYSHIPGAAFFLQNTDMDWQYKTVPQTKCCNGLKENKSAWPRGKVLGGSGVLNLMNYVRGHPNDFNHWADLGNVGWSYKDVLKYFKKSEKIEIDRLQSSDFHGHDGPLIVTENDNPSIVGRNFIEAASHLGYPLNEDYNGAEQEGFSTIQFTIHNGKRVSTATSFLRPAMIRKNLHVLTRARVTKIVIDEKSTKVTGVEYLHGGTKHTVHVNKEVVLSAGAIASPHLLMLSGIGPKAQLQKFGIQTIQDLPAIGQNMKDHLCLHGRFSMNESTGYSTKQFRTIRGTLQNVFEYFALGSGPFSIPLMDCVGFVKSRVVESKVPEVQIYLMPIDLFIADFNSYVHLDEDAIRSLQVTKEEVHPFVVFACGLHPRSSGDITIQSSDPTVAPLIDPKYFHEEIDIDILTDGMKIVHEILNTDLMKKFDIQHYEGSLPVCAKYPQWSKDYLTCLVQARPLTLFHPVGTCRMGVSPKDSVVDSELRVHGVKGLRIADASVFPDQISANTAAAVMMVAEKAAEMIRNSK